MRPSFRNKVHNLNNLKVTVGSSTTEACGTNDTPQLAAETFPKFALGFIPVIKDHFFDDHNFWDNFPQNPSSGCILE